MSRPLNNEPFSSDSIIRQIRLFVDTHNLQHASADDIQDADGMYYRKAVIIHALSQTRQTTPEDRVRLSKEITMPTFDECVARAKELLTTYYNNNLLAIVQGPSIDIQTIQNTVTDYPFRKKVTRAVFDQVAEENKLKQVGTIITPQRTEGEIRTFNNGGFQYKLSTSQPIISNPDLPSKAKRKWVPLNWNYSDYLD